MRKSRQLAFVAAMAGLLASPASAGGIPVEDAANLLVNEITSVTMDAIAMIQGEQLSVLQSSDETHKQNNAELRRLRLSLGDAGPAGEAARLEGALRDLPTGRAAPAGLDRALERAGRAGDADAMTRPVGQAAGFDQWQAIQAGYPEGQRPQARDVASPARAAEWADRQFTGRGGPHLELRERERRLDRERRQAALQAIGVALYALAGAQAAEARVAKLRDWANGAETLRSQELVGAYQSLALAEELAALRQVMAAQGRLEAAFGIRPEREER